MKASRNVVVLSETCAQAWVSGKLDSILSDVGPSFYSVAFGAKPRKGEQGLRPRVMLCNDRIGRLGTPTCAVVGGRAYDFASFLHHSTCDVRLWKQGRKVGLADPAFRVWNAHTTVAMRVRGTLYIFARPSHEQMTDDEYWKVMEAMPGAIAR